jgi:hypothetical protein
LHLGSQNFLLHCRAKYTKLIGINLNPASILLIAVSSSKKIGLLISYLSSLLRPPSQFAFTFHSNFSLFASFPAHHTSTDHAHFGFLK